METAIHNLSVENLSFGYNKDRFILDEVSFKLAPNKITSLLGANGSGKSTLFHLLTGRLKPQSGRVVFDGKSIDEIKKKDFSQHIAVVHQYNTAPDDLTVRKLVEMGRTPYKNIFSYGQNPDDETAVENALRITDTYKYADRMISALSGGQRQRVWLALALAQNPDILLLDEITTYLDIHYQYEILNLIKELNKDKKLTVLMVIHDINQAIEFSDNSIVMKDGKIISCGETKNVVNKSVIDSAFDVDTQMIDIVGRKICVIGN